MKVFVTGSTGYIGFNVATALRRAGHEVWGLVRSEEKARLLRQHEIHPFVGTLQQASAWQSKASECSVLIHAAADFKGDTLAIDRDAAEKLLAIGKTGARSKTLIYTSGVWVYGNTKGALVDETTPLSPTKLVANRPMMEELVLNSTEVKGLVIRPGCVYGKQGGLPGLWFASATKEKSAQVIGDGSNRWAIVHVDDLADAYLRVAESGLKGEIFNVTDRSRATVAEMASAAAKAAGAQGQVTRIPLAKAAETMGDFAECFALDQHVDSRKAVSLLGWQPRHGGFVDEVQTYFESWKAVQ